jgi:hypothetical protein
MNSKFIRLVKREKATIELDKYAISYVIQICNSNEWEDLIETEDMVDGVVLLANIRKLGGLKRDTYIEV